MISSFPVLVISPAPHHNGSVLGKGRGFNKPEFKKAVEALGSRYEQLIFDNALNPSLLESFHDRVRHARNTGRNPESFLEDELQAFQELEAITLERVRTDSLREEARRRRLAGESFADKVLDEYRQRIEHYPELEIHPNADSEIAKLFGALEMLDRRHWGVLESYLRRAFPRAGQIDRMNIEQRFWRFVATRKGRLPEELERYRRTLAAPSATKKEILREIQESIKSVAFFLHDLLEVCEQASQQISPDTEVHKAIDFIQGIISDFRIKDLKRH